MDFVEIKEGILSVDEASTIVSDPQCGAISLFIGTYKGPESLGLKDRQII